jgi:iron complex transport system ATP-binding protein
MLNQGESNIGRTKVDAPLLELKDVTYRMNGRKILDRVSWTVRRGENWAILGPNGAGKTSLLKIVCGFLWPNGGGEVLRNGEAQADLGRLRRSMGWVSSALVADIPRNEPALDTVLSGRYAQLGLWTLPEEPPDDGAMQTARECLGELQCDHLAARRFGTLSQGEQQKVLVCRALMARPYLLILDEPCAGMDPGAREVFLAALSPLAEREELPALVYVTHHPEEILPAFTNTLIIKEGRTVAAGRTESTLDSRMFNDLYGVSIRLLKKKGRYWPVPE